MSIARVLIIAGSDSGGGAGIQADIKAVTMLGGHAMTAMTALTAQNSLGVQGVMPVPAAFVLAQIDSVVGDLGVDAVKIGMIGSAEVAHAVADRLESLDVPIVFDPVMVATSGSVLADAATVAAFERLMRMAALVTPNVPELTALALSVRPGLGEAPRASSEEQDAALTDSARTELGRALADHLGVAVLAKGGDLPGADVVDILLGPDGSHRVWSDPRIDTPHSHGTGCTLASAIATGLAQGMALPDAIARGRRFVRAALAHAPGLGAGHGPMGHALGIAPFDVWEARG
ncbi:bifunctional hydroxymethylpyrimidine kinase/phosphomethylpyrimidine kinase [Sphingomonas sp.]|uniref:bifunctional hydroxymethylpyrimidine kinase/phosphomethylpyrimidine kinase n=1 Tax=Sphingomonas sp. TaxID=28214 RepID=UPI002D0C1075|nr:bifunctional hydroxymethylpyrimidine kinase/phosphomethylpyrimidine kinase [Sphingomonas sp.]HWK36674.1 bifunctional hydroxymethylpyrimidine kinase/phosphomethylpyrimidine kinase [Sphingomonas sp.]